MAFDFSKISSFLKLNARSRVVVLVLGVLGVIFLIYFGTRYFFGTGDEAGPTRVAEAPSGLQSIPGQQQLIPAYQQAVEQASSQREEQARMTGTSAVPTLIRPAGPANASECTIVCSEQSVNVKDVLDNWVNQGQISPEVASSLQALANRNVTPEEYADTLNQLVKEGKITPEQARQLLDQYRKQHTNALLQESVKPMDEMIKTGALPLDTANELLTAQKNRLSPTQYAALAQQLVSEGKLTPEAAQRLVGQYSQQFAREVTNRSIVELQRMARGGQIIPEVLNTLVDLEKQMVPLNTLSQTLDKYVAEGKLTPAVSKKILDEYIQQKSEIGSSSAIENLQRKANAAALQEINDLLKSGKMTVEVAAQLTGMIQRNVTYDEYVSAVDQLVKQNKLSADIATLKKRDYQIIKGVQAMQQRLDALRANNASPAQYAEELKKAVQAGLMTPEEAAQAMKEFQTIAQQAATTPTVAAVTPEYAALQERLQRLETAQPAPETTAAEFAVAREQVTQEETSDRQARIDALTSAMSGHAQQLVSTWQEVPKMEHKAGTPPKEKECPACDGKEAGKDGKSNKGKGEEESGGIPLIKAGTIYFGILETAVNSDYPDTPVMVTIVEGPFKGAKLLGKLQTATNVAGQLDRVSLTFNLMNMDQWPRSKTVTAFAIDPDTARTQIASHVNYHYLKRYGAMMATSFLEGYANAISTSGSTTTTGIFGTSTTHPELSPGEKFATALGQIGTNLGQVTQNYTNIPPTVRVDSGVSLGILFMADVV